MAIQAPLLLVNLLAIFALLVCSGLADYVLYTGEVLTAGQNLTNGRYQLAMQPNCDLVLYDGEKPIWRTDTSGKGDDCYLVLKHKGELVLKRSVHYTIWSSNSKAKKGKYALVLESHGGISIYGQRRWITTVSKDVQELGEASRSVVTTQYLMYSGGRLNPGEKLNYKNYEMGLTGCNLFINDTRTGRILWQTNTLFQGCYLQLESSGELNLMNYGLSLWSSDKKSDDGVYVGVLRYDGRLAIYGPQIWSNVKIVVSMRSDELNVSSSSKHSMHEQQRTGSEQSQSH